MKILIHNAVKRESNYLYYISINGDLCVATFNPGKDKKKKILDKFDIIRMQVYYCEKSSRFANALEGEQ